jgi:hypothetical protein
VVLVLFGSDGLRRHGRPNSKDDYHFWTLWRVGKAMLPTNIVAAATNHPFGWFLDRLDFWLAFSGFAALPFSVSLIFGAIGLTEIKTRSMSTGAMIGAAVGILCALAYTLN